MCFWVEPQQGAEGLGEHDKGDVAVPADKAAAFEMVQAEADLQLAIVVLCAAPQGPLWRRPGPRRPCGRWGSGRPPGVHWRPPMMTAEADRDAVERRLLAGDVVCSKCGVVLAPWGSARPRKLRGLQADLSFRPRRGLCSGCGVTHVLLQVDALVRRADTVEVIGAALVAKAAGRGHRGIAEQLERAPSTVRGWLRRLGSRAEQVRAAFAALAATISTEAPLPPSRRAGRWPPRWRRSGRLRRRWRTGLAYATCRAGGWRARPPPVCCWHRPGPPSRSTRTGPGRRCCNPETSMFGNFHVEHQGDSVTDVDDHVRRQRADRVALWRYQLIREPADPELSTKARGRLVRALAQAVHPGPFGTEVRVSRPTLDRWIRAWRQGGFDALQPPKRQVEARTPAEVLDLAAALKRERPERTAAQVVRILRAQSGWAPSERTLLRHFDRIELNTRRRDGPRRHSADSKPRPLTSAGSATHFTARSSPVTRATCFASSMIIHAR
jgi:transposase